MAVRADSVYIGHMTNKQPPRKPDDPEQYKRFLEAAKKAGADKTEAGADRAFKKVTAKPPKASPEKA
jgi:hypothetical protein